MHTQVAVIGGGISGLACAYRLFQLGVPVTLLEAAERAGGLIGTDEQDGFLFDTGPQSLQGIDSILDLVRDVGLENHLCQADAHAPRYVLRRGKLEKIPMSPQLILGSSLLSLGARVRIAREALKRTRPPTEEESVAQFVRRKFGHEILEYLVAPFVSGVYAGDPEKLSLRAAFPTLDEWERSYGSVLRGAMKSRSRKGARSGPPPLCSFDRGMAMLPATLAARLGESIHLGAHADTLTRVDGLASTRYRVRFTQKGQALSLDADAVVLATPAYVAARLIDPISTSLARTLSSIAYAGVAVVSSCYYSRQVGDLDGFGVLVPRSEKCRTLGIVWNSSLFPRRGGEDLFTLTSFVGGATDGEILERTDDEILRLVQDESARILNIVGPPTVSRLVRHPKALPQYNLGHGHLVGAIGEAERAIPALYLAGNYLEGPSIGKCAERGARIAEQARDDLRRASAKTA